MINESRIALVNGSEEWKKRESDRIDALKDDIKRINKRWVNWKDKRLDRKIVRKLEKVAKKNKKIDKKQWIKNCKKGLGLFGKEIKEEFKNKNRISRYFKVRRKCKEKWELVQVWMYKKELEEREKLLSEVKEDSIRFYDERKKREVLLNPRKYMSNLSNMNKWFRRLELEMICFEKMDNPAYTKSCEKLSPQMAALYNAGRKAKDEWDKECKEKFEGIASNITTGEGSLDDFNAWLEENS